MENFYRIIKKNKHIKRMENCFLSFDLVQTLPCGNDVHDLKE